jgi:hypothetical protein
MPYIPFVPPFAGAPVPLASPITGYTNGVIQGRDYTLHLNAIALELNKIGFFLSPAAALDAGSASASLSASSLNLGIITENIADIHLEIKTLNLNLQKIANKIEVSTKGMANISSHMAKQTVIQTMVMNDQIKTSEFQKQVTNQAQEAAGQPKTVVTPADFTAKAKEVITDVTTNNALISAASMVEAQITSAATEAFTTATTWIAESAVGVWVRDAYAETEILVVGLFSKEKAKQLADKLKVRQNTIKAGGIPA